MSQPSAQAAPHPWPHPMRVASLKQSGPNRFDLRANRDQRAAIAQLLELADLTDLRFRGAITPAAADGWRIEARLTASLAQTCVVTLDPVPARIDQIVSRDFVPEEAGTIIDLTPDEEDDPDTFTDQIDPGQIAVEALALALDPYPRAPGVEPLEMRATPPGATELDDQSMKPLAGLAALKAKMQDDT